MLDCDQNKILLWLALLFSILCHRSKLMHCGSPWIFHKQANGCQRTSLVSNSAGHLHIKMDPDLLCQQFLYPCCTCGMSLSDLRTQVSCCQETNIYCT